LSTLSSAPTTAPRYIDSPSWIMQFRPMFSVIAALSTGGIIQHSVKFGEVNLSNAELVAMVEAAHRDGTALQLFCSFMPSIWDEDGTASQEERQTGCITVKAQSCVNVCYYRTSSMNVCNYHQDADLCLLHSHPPTLEEMDDICGGPNFPRPSSFGWIKGGLTYAVQCGN